MDETTKLLIGIIIGFTLASLGQFCAYELYTWYAKKKNQKE